MMQCQVGEVESVFHGHTPQRKNTGNIDYIPTKSIAFACDTSAQMKKAARGAAFSFQNMAA